MTRLSAAISISKLFSAWRVIMNSLPVIRSLRLEFLKSLATFNKPSISAVIKVTFLSLATPFLK